MQVFLVGSPYETAESLDPRRFNKQILEAEQILKAIRGDTKFWANHPVTKMYSGYYEWLKNYREVLVLYRSGKFSEAFVLSEKLELIKPKFLTIEYIENMKKRLYTKDPLYYSKWSYLGESYVNMYFVDGEWRIYDQINPRVLLVSRV